MLEDSVQPGVTHFGHRWELLHGRPWRTGLGPCRARELFGCTDYCRRCTDCCRRAGRADYSRMSVGCAAVVAGEPGFTHTAILTFDVGAFWRVHAVGGVPPAGRSTALGRRSRAIGLRWAGLASGTTRGLCKDATALRADRYLGLALAAGMPPGTTVAVWVVYEAACGISCATCLGGRRGRCTRAGASLLGSRYRGGSPRSRRCRTARPLHCTRYACHSATAHRWNLHTPWTLPSTSAGLLALAPYHCVPGIIRTDAPTSHPCRGVGPDVVQSSPMPSDSLQLSMYSSIVHCDMLLAPLGQDTESAA